MKNNLFEWDLSYKFAFKILNIFLNKFVGSSGLLLLILLIIHFSYKKIYNKYMCIF